MTKLDTLRRRQVRAAKYATSASLSIMRHTVNNTVCATPTGCAQSHYVVEITR